MPEENKELSKPQSPKQIISDANKIAQKEATRNDNFNDVSFEEYKNVAGDQMFRKMEGGRVVDTFTESEMNQAIQSRKEDSFYGFDKSQVGKMPVITDDNADTPLDITGGGGAGGGSLGVYAVKNGQIVSI
jgi:hypothetical protein